MDYSDLFIWKGYEETIELQQRLRKNLILKDDFDKINYIGGVDTSVHDQNILGVIVVIEYKTFNLVEISYGLLAINFPYIPGFLSFREGPSILEAWKKLKFKPDLLIFDGQGIAHPRGFGIASHVGLVLNVPSIGCAKSLLVGEYKEPSKKKGSFEYIVFKGQKVGAVVRTKDNVKPVFVSPGHRISLETSINIVLKTATNYRIPEPVRLAHIYSKKGWLYLEEKGKFF
ncbi:MAG: deoxyribonuclease V [candidate division WOR-3 bacterium]